MMDGYSELSFELLELKGAISDLVRGVATELGMFDLSDYIECLGNICVTEKSRPCALGTIKKGCSHDALPH